MKCGLSDATLVVSRRLWWTFRISLQFGPIRGLALTRSQKSGLTWIPPRSDRPAGREDGRRRNMHEPEGFASLPITGEPGVLLAADPAPDAAEAAIIPEDPAVPAAVAAESVPDAVVVDDSIADDPAQSIVDSA